MLRKLVKTDQIEVEGHACDVRYFMQLTGRGARRYSSELCIDGADRIILDDDTMNGLESKVERLVPAALWSRVLAGRTGVAA